MNVDLIRALFTYGTATSVALGGLLYLYATHDHGLTQVSVLVGGFVGASLQFLFGAQVQANAVARENRGSRI